MFSWTTTSHHHDLWESMELLAERLGWTLYRPIGMDWFEQGYWNHERKFHGDAVAKQYLEPWGSDWIWEQGTIDTSEGLGPDPRRGHKVRKDTSHDRWIHLLTLEQARDLKPDIVISSLAHNHEGFHRFASEVGAKFGLQIGNVRFSAQDMAEDRWDLADFGLVSARMPAPIPKPHVVYHQEFDVAGPDGDFRYNSPPRAHQWYAGLPPDRVGERFVVSSFVQCYPQDVPAYDYWVKAAEQAPELQWQVYGAYGEAPIDQYAAGNIDKCADVGSAMRWSDVAWHAKRWSDGYGHVIHNWFSVGRPVLGFHDYYKDQLAGDLWVEGETAWDIGHRSPSEVAELLRRFRDDEDFHLRACEAAAARFREVVNFDAEEQDIRRLMESVL